MHKFLAHILIDPKMKKTIMIDLLVLERAPMLLVVCVLCLTQFIQLMETHAQISRTRVAYLCCWLFAFCVLLNSYN